MALSAQQLCRRVGALDFQPTKAQAEYARPGPAMWCGVLCCARGLRGLIIAQLGVHEPRGVLQPTCRHSAGGSQGSALDEQACTAGASTGEALAPWRSRCQGPFWCRLWGSVNQLCGVAALPQRFGGRCWTAPQAGLEAGG